MLSLRMPATREPPTYGSGCPSSSETPHTQRGIAPTPHPLPRPPPASHCQRGRCTWTHRLAIGLDGVYKHAALVEWEDGHALEKKTDGAGNRTSPPFSLCLRLSVLSFSRRRSCPLRLIFSAYSQHPRPPRRLPTSPSSLSYLWPLLCPKSTFPLPSRTTTTSPFSRSCWRMRTSSTRLVGGWHRLHAMQPAKVEQLRWRQLSRRTFSPGRIPSSAPRTYTSWLAVRIDFRMDLVPTAPEIAKHRLGMYVSSPVPTPARPHEDTLRHLPLPAPALLPHPRRRTLQRVRWWCFARPELRTSQSTPTYKTRMNSTRNTSPFIFYCSSSCTCCGCVAAQKRRHKKEKSRAHRVQITA
jgi:hypothetical protein